MYYLHHYFDPDFTHTNLSPQEAIDGSVDYRYLGYVQNVVAGQVLAEVIDLEKYPNMRRDPRFIYHEKRIPCGPNTSPHIHNPNTIIATTNGYVFYYNGLICVKKLLNIRGNLGFHTGNIFFIGDIAVHGDVQTNFSVQATNILVKGHVESAKVKASGNIVCLAGVKGTNTELEAKPSQEEEPIEENITAKENFIVKENHIVHNTLLDAKGTIRLPFCENVQLRAKGDVIIDGSCLHSTIYVEGNLIVKGRVIGGSIYSNGIIYVEKQLGSSYTVLTRIVMGYDPFIFLKIQKLESQIRYLKDKAEYFSNQAARNEIMEQEFSPRLEIVSKKLDIIMKKHTYFCDYLQKNELKAKQYRVIVPGEVMPGCEINIGHHFYKTNVERNVTFQLKNDEIKCTYPALSLT